MTKNKIYKDSNNKFSARLSIFAWTLCAVIGWAVAFTTLKSITSSDSSIDATITAENTPSPKDAAKMESILPAAGKK